MSAPLDPSAWGAVISETTDQLLNGDPVGVLTGVAVREGADVVMHLRQRVAPMHLVMAAYAVTREAEDAIGRAAGDHGKALAALIVARHLLKQAMEEGR